MRRGRRFGSGFRAHVFLVRRNPISRDLVLSRREVDLIVPYHRVQLVFEPVLHMCVPRLRQIRLRPKILDRVGAAKFQGNQVINFELAGGSRRDAVLGVHLLFHALRDVANLLRISRHDDVFTGHWQHGTGRQFRIRLNWRSGKYRRDEKSYRQEERELLHWGGEDHQRVQQ